MGRPPADAVDTATPQRILAAAEESFGRLGLQGARLADIALAAGITRPSLLYHFPTKDALYTAVVQGAFGRLRGALEEAIAGRAELGPAMDAATRAYLGVLEEHPHLAGIILRELLAGDGPGARILLDEIVPLLDFMERFVRQVGGDPAPDLPARAAVLQLAAAGLVRAASGPALREPLWGENDHTRGLARILFRDERETS